MLHSPRLLMIFGSLPGGAGCDTSAARATDEGPASTYTLGRAWPFAKRFEFTFRDAGAFSRARADPAVRAAIAALKLADAPSLRTPYFASAHERATHRDAAAAASAAARSLDEAMAALGLLTSEFTPEHAPDCAAAAAAVTSLSTADLPSVTLDKDGNWPFAPTACQAHRFLAR